MTPALRSPWLRAAAVVAIAALALAGCGRKEEPADKTAAPVSDREIRIVEVKPALDTLKTGDSVKLVISGTYRVPEPGGVVGVVVQDAKDAMVANRLTQVTAGTGKFSEEVEFTVPATDRLVVHVPLYLKGESKTTTVAKREYPVTSK